MDLENNAAAANGCIAAASAHITLVQPKAAALAVLATLDKWQTAAPAPSPAARDAASHVDAHYMANSGDACTPPASSGKKPFLQRGSGLKRRQEAWRSEQRYIPPGGFLLAPELDASQAPFGGALPAGARPPSAPAKPGQQTRAGGPSSAARQAGATAATPASRRGRLASTGEVWSAAAPASKAPSKHLLGESSGGRWVADRGQQEAAWGAGDAALVDNPAYLDSDLVAGYAPPLTWDMDAEDARTKPCADHDDNAQGSSSAAWGGHVGATATRAWEDDTLLRGPADGITDAARIAGGEAGCPDDEGAGLPLDGAWGARDVDEARARGSCLRGLALLACCLMEPSDPRAPQKRESPPMLTANPFYKSASCRVPGSAKLAQIHDDTFFLLVCVCVYWPKAFE